MTAAPTTPPFRPPLLHPRHVAVLTAIAVGLPQEAAARRLGASERTLRRLVTEAEQRLGARCTVHAVALAMAHGLIDVAHVRAGTVPDVQVVDPAVRAIRIRAANTAKGSR